MKCPFCGHIGSKVNDTRHLESGEIRRRRECEECGRKYTTYERIESIPLMVIKKDKSRESYNRDKIKSGISRSCHKRPVSAELIDKMTDTVENEIFNKGIKEISTTVIGELVMDQLKKVDEVAYVRFASVYREFKDVNTFMQEIQKVFDN